jgi:hypothetical protein
MKIAAPFLITQIIKLQQVLSSSLTRLLQVPCPQAARLCHQARGGPPSQDCHKILTLQLCLVSLRQQTLSLSKRACLTKVHVTCGQDQKLADFLPSMAEVLKKKRHL